MGKTKEIILSEEQKSALDKAYRFGSCHRFRMRCKAILMKAENKSMKEIQDFVGYGRLAIYRWFKQYQSEGLDSLREKGGRGAKPLMSSADTEAVKEAVRNFLCLEIIAGHSNCKSVMEFVSGSVVTCIFKTIDDVTAIAT